MERLANTVRHSTVYAEPGVFAGWPANHGAWQWGDEFLVGFMVGPYTRKARTHQIDEPFTKLQARSLDGGETWRVERPNVDFEARVTTSAPPFRLGEAIIRACGVYDHGGDHCDPGGGFYVSHDRGASWGGAFAFSGIEERFAGPWECSARTAVAGDLTFLSRRIAGRFGTDSAFVARHDGERFHLHGVVCDDGSRAAMPSAAKIGDRIVAAVRRTDFRRYWIEAFGSDDGGLSWRPLSDVVTTSKRNGNPPALLEVNGALVCAYGERDRGAINVCVSRDGGDSWSAPEPIRERGKSDIGYPQLFRRSDGSVVCVYYWAAGVGDHQHIEATIFRP